MEREPRLRGEAALARLPVVRIDVAQRLEDVAALLGKIRRDVDDMPAGMTETVGEHDREGLRDIARQGIAHLNRRLEAGRPLREHSREIFARVPAAGEIQ